MHENGQELAIQHSLESIPINVCPETWIQPRAMRKDMRAGYRVTNHRNTFGMITIIEHELRIVKLHHLPETIYMLKHSTSS